MSYKNNVTVIIGSAGSGKSTLIDLIVANSDIESRYLFTRDSVDVEKSLEQIVKDQQTAHSLDQCKEILIAIDCHDEHIYRSEVVKLMCYQGSHMKITSYTHRQLEHGLLCNAKNIIFTDKYSLTTYTSSFNELDKSYEQKISLF
jgi:predicted ATPase